jgi:hypothetical protein
MQRPANTRDDLIACLTDSPTIHHLFTVLLGLRVIYSGPQHPWLFGEDEFDFSVSS